MHILEYESHVCRVKHCFGVRFQFFQTFRYAIFIVNRIDFLFEKKLYMIKFWLQRNHVLNLKNETHVGFHALLSKVKIGIVEDSHIDEYFS